MAEERTAYAVTLARDGGVAAEGNEPVRLELEWTPEHLVLAALARCSVASLVHHARRRSLDVAASAHATGSVGRRDDGSWGFLELECRPDVELRPEPDADALAELVAKAERGCFVGASLAPAPTYRWTVNGRELEPPSR
jgi:uncharacterized OsmC-like protein